MKNTDNQNSPQEKKKYLNPWRKSLPPFPPKPKYRTLKRAILILLAFFVLAFVIPRLYTEISFRWQYRDLIAQEKAFQRDYVKYSGKTPQEVYEKYVSALKRGDIEEAAKYYSTPQAIARNKAYWEKLKAEGKYEERVNDLPKWGELKEGEYGLPNVKRFVREDVSFSEKDARKQLEGVPEIYHEEILKIAKNNFTQDFYFDSSKKLWKLYD